MRYNTYRNLTSIFSPLIALYLRFRLMRGKEDGGRFKERFGHSGISRPPGILLWIHAASVGEANSVLYLIEQLKSRFPDINILLTTGTVTSARLIQKRGLRGVIHQFVPVDTDEATTRFLRHWRPDIGLWVESELWPNLVINARAWGCFLVVINGRMSMRSYKKWQERAALMAFQVLSSFELVFAQTEDDAQRFRALGAKNVRYVGNLKYDADALPCNETDLFVLQQQVGLRPLWFAASTHANEEGKLAEAHKILSEKHKDLLTIIAPRHPERGGEIEQQLAKYGNVALRSRGDKIRKNTGFYIADTLGELGLFYRLCEIIFIGGSLIEHGGHNPLEAARLRCCVITGPHTENFADMYAEMEKLSICIRVRSAGELAGKIDSLMQDSDELTRMQMLAKEWLRSKSGATTRILDTLSPIFVPPGIE